ncbi:hypothetical protein M3J09_007234 [Ascochyta lentis]
MTTSPTVFLGLAGQAKDLMFSAGLGWAAAARLEEDWTVEFPLAGWTGGCQVGGGNGHAGAPCSLHRASHLLPQRGLDEPDAARSMCLFS